MTIHSQYDALVIIGRFQPFHKGHLQLITQALEQCRHLIVLCGSTNLPRTIENPWSWSEREEMILGALSDSQSERVSVVPVQDALYARAQWQSNVQQAVTRALKITLPIGLIEPNVGLVVSELDDCAGYQRDFATWSQLELPRYGDVSDEVIREAMMAGLSTANKWLPSPSRNAVQILRASDSFGSLLAEQAAITRFRQEWAMAPYPPVFVTVDAIVCCGGHILVVERGQHPGLGLKALPGGFIDVQETLIESCLRELHEETGLDLRDSPAKCRMVRNAVFDAPYRSQRGRVITHVYQFEYSADEGLPKVQGGDDACHAMWVPVGALSSESFFDDHFFILQYMLLGGAGEC